MSSTLWHNAGDDTWHSEEKLVDSTPLDYAVFFCLSCRSIVGDTSTFVVRNSAATPVSTEIRISIPENYPPRRIGWMLSKLDRRPA